MILFQGFRQDIVHGPGFRTHDLLMMSFNPALVRYSDAQTQQFYKQLLQNVRSNRNDSPRTLVGGRIPCFSAEVDPKATLYVGYGTGENRDRRAQLRAQHCRDRFRARAEVQERTAPE